MNSSNRNRQRDWATLSSGRRWYRLPSSGMLAGICAGLADYYEISRLMVRMLVITAACFAPQIILIGYIVGIFALPTRRQLQARVEREEQSICDGAESEGSPLDRKRVQLKRFRERFAKLDRRLQVLEGYVTSRRFDLGREIDGL